LIKVIDGKSTCHRADGCVEPWYHWITGATSRVRDVGYLLGSVNFYGEPISVIEVVRYFRACSDKSLVRFLHRGVG